MHTALRFLWRRPVFALTGILTVAVGVGANTALFGVVYSTLIQPLPFRDPGRLVQIWETHPAVPQLQVTAPDLQDWQAQAHSFEQVAAYTLSAMNNTTLLGQGEAASVHATMASGNLFSTMGIQLIVGRVYSEDEVTSRQRVALLSEKLWRAKFGADVSVAGRQIRIGSDSFRVVGVVPQRQAFPEWADLWIPLSLMEPQLQNRRKFHPLEVIARLKPGVTVEQAQIEMQTLAQRLAQAHPDTNAKMGAYVVPLAQEVTQAVRPSLLLTWGAVGLVLLIACANLGHLFLARLIERREEMAIREALGAKPWHLMSQLMTESLLVASIGGALGVLVAAMARSFDGPVWLFAAGISLFAGVLFGVPACWQAWRGPSRLGASGRSIVRTRTRLGSALIAGEVAMALLVLSGAALLTRNFAALVNEDPGFQAREVWEIANLPLRDDWDKSAEFLDTRLAPELRKIPGVVDVAAVNSAPLTLGATEHTRFATRFGIEGRTFDAGSFPVAQNRWMTPEYFRVLGIPLRGGGFLTEADRNQPRILVNETLARRYFPGQDAVGKRLILGVMDPQQQLLEIVGVVGDIRDLGLDQEAASTLYGIGTSPVMTLVVKTAAGSSGMAVALRNAIRSADPEIAVNAIHPLEQNLSDSLARRRSAVLLLSVFAGIAAFLTAGGIYGLLTHSVNARVRELGVRAAVGASPGELVSMILREALVLTIPGLVVGVALALGFSKVMRSFVYQISPTDPISIGSTAVFLILLTFMSAWFPARRAAALDPASALRAE